MRKLASIQKVSSLSPIEGADRIELAKMEGLDWECVVPKGQFQVGNSVVYFEVDSILPKKDEFEFLREVKYRIKIRKFRKVCSYGLIQPMSILPETDYPIGTDVSEIIGVTKYDPQFTEEQALVESKRRGPVMKALMRNRVFRTIYMKATAKQHANWPSTIQKTDEERINNCAHIIMDHWTEPFFITEKLDGQSSTFFSLKFSKRPWVKREFGVCSRNIWLKKKDASNYWKITEKYDLKNKLQKFGTDVVVQGEILNTNVQGNKYKVTEPLLYVFNVIVNGVRIPLDHMITHCEKWGLTTVPIIEDRFVPSEYFADLDKKEWESMVEKRAEVVKRLLDFSTEKSVLYPAQTREGVVMRLHADPSISLKVISPKFQIEHES